MSKVHTHTHKVAPKEEPKKETKGKKHSADETRTSERRHRQTLLHTHHQERNLAD